jgi:hypothetical protein
MVPVSKQWHFDFIPEIGLIAANFGAAYGSISRHTSR